MTPCKMTYTPTTSNYKYPPNKYVRVELHIKRSTRTALVLQERASSENFPVRLRKPAGCRVRKQAYMGVVPRRQSWRQTAAAEYTSEIPETNANLEGSLSADGAESCLHRRAAKSDREGRVFE